MYTPLFFAWTKRLGLDDHAAADLVQDLFTVLVEQLPHFDYDQQGSFRACDPAQPLAQSAASAQGKAGGRA
jgi:hypothetical protein